MQFRDKKNVVRRLPQWDSLENSLDPFDTVDGNLLPVNPVCCSCRTSCRSLRCSCAKAAKSCSNGDNVCLCANCDNPLNVLASLGMDLEFSLRDCCLFQNIYGIPNLPDFLMRDIKLSCCNSVGRVMDCIPGSHLCPNTECDACLEFSWCRGIICYPERNPRNHCSICGQCCFSNGRHCPICNRCYVVTSKCPDCPNCRGNGFQMYPVGQNLSVFENPFKAPDAGTSTKPCPKPEIVLLDKKGEARPLNPEDLTQKREGESDPKGMMPPSPTLEEEYYIDEENKPAVIELFARLRDELSSTVYS